jgi:hypothetical protein
MVDGGMRSIAGSDCEDSMANQEKASQTQHLGTLLADPRRARELRICRIVGGLWALTFWGLAALTFTTGHFFGYTKQSHELSLTGLPALAMGVFQAALGGVMLAFFARSSRAALVWMLSCFGLGAAAVLTAILLR